MVVTVDGEKKDVDAVSTVSEMLEALKLHPDSVIVIRDRRVLRPEDAVSQTDEIRVVGIVSGG